MDIEVMKRTSMSLLAEASLVIALILTAAPAPARAETGALQGSPTPVSEDDSEIEIVDNEVAAETVPLLEFWATAYCLRGRTSSGVHVNPGSIAADPDVLPIGSIIRLHAGRYSGIYTVLDTGAKVRGRRLDIWLPEYDEAIEFGRRKVKVEIIRYGWDPAQPEVSSLDP